MSVKYFSWKICDIRDLKSYRNIFPSKLNINSNANDDSLKLELILSFNPYKLIVTVYQLKYGFPFISRTKQMKPVIY